MEFDEMRSFFQPPHIPAKGMLHGRVMLQGIESVVIVGSVSAQAYHGPAILARHHCKRVLQNPPLPLPLEVQILEVFFQEFATEFAQTAARRNGAKETMGGGRRRRRRVI